MGNVYDSEFLVKRGNGYEKHNFSTTAAQVAYNGGGGADVSVQEKLDGILDDVGGAKNSLTALERSLDAMESSFLTLRDMVDNDREAINSRIDSAIGNNRLEFRAITYSSPTTTTMTKLFVDLSAPCMCITSTENVSDGPEGKYGTIVVFKFSTTRAGATCYCTDGTVLHNAWNASTSKVTGWA